MQHQEYYEPSRQVVNSKEDNVGYSSGLSFPISATIDDGTQHQPEEGNDSLPTDAQTHGPPGIAQHMTQESRMMNHHHPSYQSSMIMDPANHGINITTTDLFDSKPPFTTNTPVTTNISSDPVLAFPSASSHSQPMMSTSYYHRRQPPPPPPHTNYPASRDPFFSSATMHNSNNNNAHIDTMQEQNSNHSELSSTSRVFPYQLPPIMLSSTDTGNSPQQQSSSSPNSSILQISNAASTASHPLHTSGAFTTTCSPADWTTAYATTSSSSSSSTAHHTFSSNFPPELNMIPITTKSPHDLHATTTNRNILPSSTTKPYLKEAETRTSSSLAMTTKELDTHEWNSNSDMIQEPRRNSSRAIIIDARSGEDSSSEDEGSFSTQRRRHSATAAIMSSTNGDAASRDFGKEDNNAPSRDSGLEHLVSPRAIREAEREEREVAIRGTRHEHPFSAFPSFMSMKHLQEDEIKAYYHRIEKENDHHHPPSLPLHHRQASLSPSYTEESSSCSSPTSNSPLLSSPTPITDHHHHHQRTISTIVNDIMEPQADTEKKRSSKTLKKERLKRPPNGYLLFNRDMRRKLLEKSPKMTVAEISKEIGDMWKRLPENQRDWYMQQAALIKQDHLKNHPGFIYHRRSKAEIAQARRLAKQRRTSATAAAATTTTTHPTHEEPSVTISKGNWVVSTTAMTSIIDTAASEQQQEQQQHSRKKSTTTTRDPRGRKKKRHRHPEAPKHPMSGFLFFLSAMRPHVARQYPGYPVGPISQIIAKQWRAMPDEERLPWLQKAEEDKARYAREMQVYMANLERGSVAQQAPVETNDQSNTTSTTTTTTGQQQQVLPAPSSSLIPSSSSPPTTTSSSFQSSFFAPGLMASAHVDGANSASKYTSQHELAW